MDHPHEIDLYHQNNPSLQRIKPTSLLLQTDQLLNFVKNIQTSNPPPLSQINHLISQATLLQQNLEEANHLQQHSQSRLQKKTELLLRSSNEIRDRDSKILKTLLDRKLELTLSYEEQINIEVSSQKKTVDNIRKQEQALQSQLEKSIEKISQLSAEHKKEMTSLQTQIDELLKERIALSRLLWTDSSPSDDVSLVSLVERLKGLQEETESKLATVSFTHQFLEKLLAEKSQLENKIAEAPQIPQQTKPEASALLENPENPEDPQKSDSIQREDIPFEDLQEAYIYQYLDEISLRQQHLEDPTPGLEDLRKVVENLRELVAKPLESPQTVPKDSYVTSHSSSQFVNLKPEEENYLTSEEEDEDDDWLSLVPFFGLLVTKKQDQTCQMIV